MNANGSKRRKLTNDSAQERSGKWSPDGKKIVFCLRKRSIIRIPFLWEGKEKYYIVVVNSDGSEKKRLAEPARNPNPVWSPVPLATEGK
jgi:Tol biopolymer transport system component